MAKEKRPPRAFTLTLDEDLAEFIEGVRVAEGFESSAAATRHLLRSVQGATPEDGYLRSVRLRAYEEVKRVVLTRANEALHQICTEMEQAARMLGGGE